MDFIRLGSVNSKSFSKRKILFFILIFFIITIGLLFLFYLYPSCKDVLSSTRSSNEMLIKNYMLNYLKNVCTVHPTTNFLEANLTLIRLIECNETKIGYMLENVSNLELEEIETYLLISSRIAVEKIVSNFKRVIENDFSRGCSPFKKFAANYTLLFLGFSLGYSHSILTLMIDICMKNEKLTPTEKRNCLANLLEALKEQSISYSKQEYFKDSMFCDKSIFMRIFCHKVNSYIIEMKDLVDKQYLNYYQKYLFYLTIMNMDYYLKEIRLIEDVQIYRDLEDKIKTEFRTIFRDVIIYRKW